MHLLNLIPIISALGLASLFAHQTKIYFRNAVPIVVSLITLVLYLITTLNLAFYGAILLYLLGCSALIYMYIKHQSFFDLAREYKLQIFAYLIIIFLVGCFYNDAYITVWDDLTFWGIASKELVIRSHFETSLDSSSIMSIHAHYPRGSAVFHYFYLLPTGFSDGGALFAHFLLSCVFLAPIFFNKNIASSLSVIGLVFSIAALSSPFLRSLYNDAIIGFIFTSSILIYISEKDKSQILLLLLPLQVILPLFKEVGMVLACISGLILGYYHLKFLFHKKLLGLSDDHLKIYSLAIIPTITLWLHSLFYEYTHEIFDRNTHSFSNIFNVLSNFGSADLMDILRFLKLLLLSLFKEAAIATYLTIYAAYYYTKKEDKYLHEEYKVLIKAITFGFIAFIIWRLYINIFIFRYMSNGSLPRYLARYGLVFSIVSCFFLLKTKILINLPIKKNERAVFIFVTLFALITVMNSFDRVDRELSLDEKNYLSQIHDAIEEINKGEKVELSYENKENQGSCHFLAYSIAPHMSSDEIKKCTREKVNYHNVYLGKVKSIPTKPNENCHLIFKPFLREFAYSCPEQRKENENNITKVEE